MRSLGETAQQVAQRMRTLAEGVADEADAKAIRQYADWLERPDNRQVLEEPLEPRTVSAAQVVIS